MRLLVVFICLILSSCSDNGCNALCGLWKLEQTQVKKDQDRRQGYHYFNDDYFVFVYDCNAADSNYIYQLLESGQRLDLGGCGHAIYFNYETNLDGRELILSVKGLDDKWFVPSEEHVIKMSLDGKSYLLDNRDTFKKIK